MNIEYFKTNWNLLITGAGIILTFLSGFIEIPSHAAIALGSNANYELLAKFVVTIIIALMMIPCALFNRKRFRIMWALVTLLLLLVSLFFYFKSTSLKKKLTVDYTTYSGRYIVKGNTLFTHQDSLWKEMEKIKKSKISETEFFAENQDPNDSTGVLTAALLWPETEIEQNAKKIIYIYLGSVVLFALTAVGAVQTVFCISAKE